MVGNTKMWYNRTEVATKEELENVKGLIDVSARLVGVYELDNASSYPIPGDFDYIRVIFCYGNNNDYGGECVRFLTHNSSCTVYAGYDLYTNELRSNYFTVTLSPDGVLAYENTSSVMRLITIECYKYQ